MTRPNVPLSRRQFLLGSAGFRLALPLLPSLLTTQAYAADPVVSRQPRLFWLTTNHGGAFESTFFPHASGEPDTRMLFPDHQISASTLVASGSARAGTTALSSILRAPSELLTARRVGQLNVLRGLDFPFVLGHHTGGHLGNYGYNDGLAGIAREAQDDPRPTIDQLLAWSEAFYTDLSSVRERALVMGTRAVSFGYASPSGGTGSVQNVRGTTSSLALFHRIFMPGADPEATRVPLVDRVLESYRRLRHGHRRLSKADGQRLDDHMDRVAELQRKLSVAFPVACQSASTPDGDSALHARPTPEDALRYAQLFNEVVAAAFICGATRIATLSLADEQRFAAFTGDWHFDVAHYWYDPMPQAMLAQAYQRVFEGVFLDLVARLDTEEADGASYLDNSLMVWSQESGMSTHDPISLPVVTAGSAAGFFRTGLSVDYRNLKNPELRYQPLTNMEPLYPGLLYNQFLANVLLAMGLSPTEFERWGHRGYGIARVETNPALPLAKHYRDPSSRYFQIASDSLPFLKA